MDFCQIRLSRASLAALHKTFYAHDPPSDLHFDDSRSIPTYPTSSNALNLALTRRIQKQEDMSHDPAPAIHPQEFHLLVPSTPHSPTSTAPLHIIPQEGPTTFPQLRVPCWTLDQPISSLHRTKISRLEFRPVKNGRRYYLCKHLERCSDKHLWG